MVLRLRPMTGDDVQRAARLATQLRYPNTPEAIARRLDAIAGSPEDYVCVADTADVPVAGWIHLHVLRSLESEEQVEVRDLSWTNGAGARAWAAR